jgi:uncharacterized LabA/DUF88 family protein
MAHPTKEVIDQLGLEGLTRALDDLLDQRRLVRLATACGIKYRGMRTQSQSRERLVQDVAQRARRQVEARKAVLRALDREVAEPAREWQALSAEEKIARLSDRELLHKNGNVGRYLYLLATARDENGFDEFSRRLAQVHLLALAPVNGTRGENGNGAEPGEEERLRRQVKQRERKLKHLEGQLTKARDAQKSTKQDLIQRKGEIAEARMLVERLRREVAQAQSAAQALTSKLPTAPIEKAIGELGRTVKQLGSEQKKLTHQLDGAKEKKQARTDSTTLRALHDSVRALEKGIAAEAKLRDKQLDAIDKRLESLRAELKARPAAAATAKPVRRSRARGQEKRVGVFIDVQNMYYGARRLKGKLDFAALLEGAVKNRRLIKATAYVVESKETDQSHFIDVLQKLSIEVRRKTVQVRADGSRKGDWDMELALDVLDGAGELDVVVLVSGDGDFTSLVKKVKRMGPRVEVVGFPRTTAKSLLQAADAFQPLDRKFMIYSRATKRSDERKAAKKAAAKSPA